MELFGPLLTHARQRQTGNIDANQGLSLSGKQSPRFPVFREASQLNRSSWHASPEKEERRNKKREPLRAPIQIPFRSPYIYIYPQTSIYIGRGIFSQRLNIDWLSLYSLRFGYGSIIGVRGSTRFHLHSIHLAPRRQVQKAPWSGSLPRSSRFISPSFILPPTDLICETIRFREISTGKWWRRSSFDPHLHFVWALLFTTSTSRNAVSGNHDRKTLSSPCISHSLHTPVEEPDWTTSPYPIPFRNILLSRHQVTWKKNSLPNNISAVDISGSDVEQCVSTDPTFCFPPFQHNRWSLVFTRGHYHKHESFVSAAALGVYI